MAASAPARCLDVGTVAKEARKGTTMATTGSDGLDFIRDPVIYVHHVGWFTGWGGGMLVDDRGYLWLGLGIAFLVLSMLVFVPEILG